MFAVPGNLGWRVCRTLLAGWLLFSGANLCAAPVVTVTVTRRAPMESLSATGDVRGVSESAVGTRYSLVSQAADQLILQDGSGEYRIATAATDYVAPVITSPPAATNSATTVIAPTNAVAQAVPAATPPPANDASTSSPGAAGTSSPMPEDKVDAINAGLGKPLFGNISLWQETGLMIAQRLGLGLEGRTKWETSYRRYFSGDADDPKSALLGTGAYCIALYGDADDHPTSLLIAFVNDGDFKNVAYVKDDIYRIDHPRPGTRLNFPGMTRDQLYTKYQDIVASFETTRRKEEELLVKNLSSLFGDPQKTSFGSDAATREDSQRWDWSDVSFLLTCQVNKYNLLRIIPTALADSNGRAERIPRDEIGKKLSGAVEHRPNGDVVITQIPMADQGPKGYCVPATWERVLRYTGVPGDMYTLSRIGNAGFGGGEYGGNIAQELDDTLHNYGRHTEFLNIDILDAISLRHYIDDGVPVFWSVNPWGYEPAQQRYSLVDRNKDWDQWKALLDQARATNSAKQAPLPQDGGHQVLITGYNPDTKELAWSDPWGRDTTERWMTMEEAQRCTLGQYYIITW